MWRPTAPLPLACTCASRIVNGPSIHRTAAAGRSRLGREDSMLTRVTASDHRPRLRLAAGGVDRRATGHRHDAVDPRRYGPVYGSVTSFRKRGNLPNVFVIHYPTKSGRCAPARPVRVRQTARMALSSAALWLEAPMVRPRRPPKTNGVSGFDYLTLSGRGPRRLREHVAYRSHPVHQTRMTAPSSVLDSWSRTSTTKNRDTSRSATRSPPRRDRSNSPSPDRDQHYYV